MANGSDVREFFATRRAAITRERVGVSTYAARWAAAERSATPS